MAPSNGIAEKPATRRAPSRVVPIVPVLPLSYLQRPAKKPATPFPSAQKVDEITQQPATPEQKDPGDGDAATPSAASAHLATRPEDSPSSTTASDDHTPDSSTICSEPTDRPPVSIAPPHPASRKNPAFEQSVVANSAPELPLPSPHPVIANRSGFHQARPSDGSLVFAHHESTASSPAPHLGGYGFYPPGIVPYLPPGVLPVTAVDTYGRPLLVSPTVDSYPPTAIRHHAPPTPHSYHGSQSSQVDDHFFNHHPTMNGSHPAMNGTQSAMNGAQPAMNGSQAAINGLQPVMNGTQPVTNGTQPTANGTQSTANGCNHYRPTDGMSNEAATAHAHDMDNVLASVRSALNDNGFSDCSLHVHVPASRVFRDHPDHGRLVPTFRCPAHRVILARSPRLAELMRLTNTQPGGVIHVDVQDEWVRSDVFWHCLRALYGWNVAVGYLPSQLTYWSAKDEMKTALSYWATGAFLQFPPVKVVGADRASRLLGWETISLAVGFVSLNMAQGSGMMHDTLLDSTLNWVIYHLPQAFDVDEEAGDCGFSRLPPTDKSASYRPNPPAMNVSSRLAANPRLSQIRFGDLSEDTFDVGQLYPGSPFTPAQVNGLFSRMLLNLPFDLLKHVLEHPNLCGSAGPVAPGTRLRIIDAVRAAREKRRWEFLESTDLQARAHQERLASQPQPVPVDSVEDFWHNSLGYKEEIAIGDVPYLVRTWSLGPESNEA
ncbi:hypothetical protein QBC40DRAFT_84701 [Triangularia verruculosa]|uniref:Uncharacterized protein n=1 Tax=Triangularia verruculosa TaxID=2587418 RepID=A0AAN6XEI7_9PEZI|nr:hypothetical protein QBC40DRAFT_84701 [Triangularia verruculosa]